jgi:hypothetical protein
MQCKSEVINQIKCYTIIGKNYMIHTSCVGEMTIKMCPQAYYCSVFPKTKKKQQARFLDCFFWYSVFLGMG